MNLGSHTTVVNVYLMRGSEKTSVGRLVLKDRRIFFEYWPEFIETGLELSPLNLPLRAGLQVNEDLMFDGLFGVFNDSLPDGWGRLLLDRKLMKAGINLGAISALDRLGYVGSWGMGALVYLPEVEGVEISQQRDLDIIAQEVHEVLEYNDDSYVDELLAMNGFSAGTRPKIVINIDGQGWIVKFRSTIDFVDIGLIEYAYHLMAKEAGLEVPEAQLFPSKKGMGYFGVKRFDRRGEERIPMHTMSGLLHVDHRLPNLDYETMMKVTAWLTKDIRECEKQFRAAVFNVLSHNRDDHAKNFSFLMDEKSGWKVSPAYDLTFSSGPSREHCSMIMGEGKHPKLSHLLRLASVGSMKKERAMEIIDEVKYGVSKWEVVAKEVGVNINSLLMIQERLDWVMDNFNSK